MGQSDRSLLIHVLDPDERTRSLLAHVQIAGVQFSIPSLDGLAPSCEALRGADAVVIGVDAARGLDLVARVGAQSGMPCIIAVGEQGHDGKSLEHVLLQAELRGAAATVVKPFTPQELAAAAFAGSNPRPHPDTSVDQAGCSDRPAPHAGRMGQSDWPVA